MKKTALLFIAAAGVAFAQYKMEPAGAAPADLAPALGSVLSQQGVKILGPSGSVYCEIWFRSSVPTGPKNTEDSVAFPTIPHGTLLGVIRFPGPAADRRGQSLKPGTYTLRYSLYPVNGDHVGVAPQRDFLVLVPAADDKDPNATPSFEALMPMSQKASGTPHPAVLSIGPASGTTFPSFAKEGDKDWTLNVKVGDLPMSVILIGKVEG